VTFVLAGEVFEQTLINLRDLDEKNCTFFADALLVIPDAQKLQPDAIYRYFKIFHAVIVALAYSYSNDSRNNSHGNGIIDALEALKEPANFPLGLVPEWARLAAYPLEEELNKIPKLNQIVESGLHREQREAKRRSLEDLVFYSGLMLFTILAIFPTRARKRGIGSSEAESLLHKFTHDLRPWGP
jgi:hypothetical protein